MTALAPDNAALAPGARAPDFAVSSPTPACRALSDLRGQTVVLAFFPSGWDPAQAELTAQYNTILARLPGLNARLLDVGGDGLTRQLMFSEEAVDVPVIAPQAAQGAVAEMYGVAGRTALFVVDGDGVIRWRYVAPPGAAPDVDALASALRGLAEKPESRGLSRREFVAATFAAAFALALPWRAAEAQAPMLGGTALSGTMPVTLTVNGTAQTVNLEPRVTLLDALRERMGLTGSKKGCDHGQCGACTVHVDGRRVLSCLTLAMTCPGKQITTIEGLADGETLHPMQAAFIAHDGFQCGYCTPGQIMSAVALLHEPVGPSDDDVREMMSGNICRCGAYPNILAAVQEVRKGTPDASI